ncbi:MAG: hypothetical protein B7733_25790 [Myxococcales bacterium FL481]|nr:MAG: hypothetical protein B7733_25790 [Myxococcales bacterium FL481]
MSGPPASAASTTREDPEALGDTVVEFHFYPVPSTQIAIWLEREDGTFVRDVFVTQATGKLGIGNRPGIWDFLSSWRAPYGPRRSVLPVWAHRRGKTYPQIVWHDDKAEYQDSLGFHERTSSAETYYCRPLTPGEHDALLQSDAMTCPSPNAFRTDKGRFAQDGATSVYPPRNDLVEVSDRDHQDTAEYAELNELDAITRATPEGQNPTHTILRLREEELDEALVAFIEINLEADQHGAEWTYAREDHYVDPRLDQYGVVWRGQPSVVYEVAFDPQEPGVVSTRKYAGYGSSDGRDGAVNPPDFSIAESGGSGADRLREFEVDDARVRFAVEVRPATEDDDCSEIDSVPRIAAVEATALSYDQVQLDISLPRTMPGSTYISQLTVHHAPSIDELDDEEMEAAPQDDFSVCAPDSEDCGLVLHADGTVSVVIDELWGDFAYQFAISYADNCANHSSLVHARTTTPRQPFQQIDTFCVVSTAAYESSWHDRVTQLRAFRDQVLERFSVGRGLVRSYYAYGPALAEPLQASPHLRALTRAFLDPVVEATQP